MKYKYQLWCPDCSGNDPDDKEFIISSKELRALDELLKRFEYRIENIEESVRMMSQENMTYIDIILKKLDELEREVKKYLADKM